MARAHHDLLSVLKSELVFLEKGGYAKPSSQRPFIFQDSPACLNYPDAESPKPCSDCVFFELVPLDRRNEKIPCRHIPLDQEGQTLDLLYRRASQEEIETAVSRWLRKTLEELERGPIQERSRPKATNGDRVIRSWKPISYATGETPRVRDRIRSEKGRVGTVVAIGNAAGDISEITVRWDDGVIELRYTDAKNFRLISRVPRILAGIL